MEDTNNPSRLNKTSSWVGSLDKTEKTINAPKCRQQDSNDANLSSPLYRKNVRCSHYAEPVVLAHTSIHDVPTSRSKIRKIASTDEKNQTKRCKLHNITYVTQGSIFSQEESNLNEISTELERSNNKIETDNVDFNDALSRMERTLELQFKARETNMKKRYERKLHELKMTLELERSHTKLLSLCRNWIKFRPDFMSDFVVYLVLKESNSERNGRTRYVSSILCGIPGLNKTPWEGCLLPLVLRYEKGQHLSATIPEELSKLMKNPYGKSLSAQITIPSLCNTLSKILFSFQQVLNIFCNDDHNVNPSKVTLEEIKNSAKEYTHEVLVRKAAKCGMIKPKEKVLKHDVIAITELISGM